MSFGPDLVVTVFHMYSNPMPLNNQRNLDTLVINRKQGKKAYQRPKQRETRRLGPRCVGTGCYCCSPVVNKVLVIRKEKKKKKHSPQAQTMHLASFGLVFAYLEVYNHI